MANLYHLCVFPEGKGNDVNTPVRVLESFGFLKPRARTTAEIEEEICKHIIEDLPRERQLAIFTMHPNFLLTTLYKRLRKEMPASRRDDFDESRITDGDMNKVLDFAREEYSKVGYRSLLREMNDGSPLARGCLQQDTPLLRSLYLQFENRGVNLI